MGINQLKCHLKKYSMHKVEIFQSQPQKSYILPINYFKIWVKRQMTGKLSELSLQQEELQNFKGAKRASFSSASPSTMPSMMSSFFAPRITNGAQPSIRSVVKIKQKQVDVFYGVTFLSALPRTTQSTSLCLMLLLLLLT